MKLKKIECPQCSAPIEFKSGDKYAVCQHCGAVFELSDDDVKITVNKNVKIDSHHTRTIIDEAKIAKVKEEAKSQKRDTLIAIIVIIGAILFLEGSSLYLKHQNKEAEKAANEAVLEGKITAGYHGDYEDKNYKSVKQQLEALGFSNIKTIDMKDTGIFIWKNNKVESVTIDGNDSFDSEDYFYPDSKVIITYH